ncbi:MAG: class I SAM-dependent methyltransferase [Actinomycetota bacterium]|nr:class I SAM-dependent methyltransferase [Actinomycetota bacterium]
MTCRRGGASGRPIFARGYERLSRALDARGVVEHRRALLRGLVGHVIEVGAGNGRNFAHYPQTVAHVLAVEPEPYLRERAREASRQARVPVRVVAGLADDLPADDATFDAAVASLVLCSVPDQQSALRELARVVRPGGQLRFYEHVEASERWLRRIQRAVDLVWPHVSGGCHVSRDTAAAIEAAGFEITDLDAFRFAPSPWMLPASPHVLGVAERS